MFHAAELATHSRITPLRRDGWSCCSLPPDSVTHPDQLGARDSEWVPVEIPGTVASALRAVGRWDFEHPVDLDGFDWWFRTSFPGISDRLDHPAVLCFDGLATLAEVWLNGELILTSDNMFRSYRVDVTDKLGEENELVIAFRSLSYHLQQKRPRPRWKTNLVSHQQLRWLRTSLLGRIPGWSPPVPPVGPWRDIRLETHAVHIWDRHIHTRLEGTTGIVRFQAKMTATAPIIAAELRVGDQAGPLRLTSDDDGQALSGELCIDHPPVWWPHTHGEPRLVSSSVTVACAQGSFTIPCGNIGFRQLDVETGDDGFSIHVNGVPIFCRGACWTVSDIFTLTGTPESLEQDLQWACDAGANMLRVVGTMTYESERFYDLCDRLGLLVWQDFPFANMDYPVWNAEFLGNVEQEAIEQLRRLASHPCVAVYCGNSEVEQQAAMLGLPRDVWRNSWFADDLPALCAAHHPGTAYVPSTPSGGALPFHPGSGLTHYYGVGAYLRSVDDVRRSDVHFTPECLGFSNLPEDSTIEAITGGSRLVTHAPPWKRRIPRDSGAGWDFEDVRDHYVRELFGVDPVLLRSHDMGRYLELGRVATGEMMAQVFSEWRSGHSRCRGALVWFYKDLWPAAGWGVLDSAGQPKAAYYALKRLWNPRQLTITDEGLNGVHLHLTNETAGVNCGFVEVQLLREPNTVIAAERIPVEVPARSRVSLSADEVLGRFCDVSYAYRFGPPQHDIVVATWFDEQQQPISEAFHFIRKREPAISRALTIEASAQAVGPGVYQVEIRSDSFLHFVRLRAASYLPSDNYFHVFPRRTKTVHFRSTVRPPAEFSAELEALNLDGSLPIPRRTSGR
jgi:beta-mannosidase